MNRSSELNPYEGSHALVATGYEPNVIMMRFCQVCKGDGIAHTGWFVLGLITIRALHPFWV